MKAKFTLLFILFSLSGLFSQKVSDRPDIFIDCQMRCDFTYIKQEIQFVNYMNDRELADIYILATQQSSGAGGREVQMVFIGNQEFSEISDTIRYFTDPNATDAIEREQFVREFKKGLLQFLIKTPLIDKIDYNIISEETDEIQDDVIKDPWNFWVFNIGGNAWLNGEDSYNSIDLTGRFNVSRVTDENKINFRMYYNYERSKFTLTDGEEFTSFRKSYNVNLTYVKSLGSKWSAGFTSRVGSSTFGNTDIDASFKPALEYNIYPYTESSTRRFSFLYSIGPEYYNYTDTTIYDRVNETRLRHGLNIEFEQTQKWGSVEFDIGIKQYFHDPKLYSAFFNPNIEWQIFRGLSIDIGGFISFVSDRINIAKSDITDEDIILKIKQLDTDFTYFTYVGLNYRFGSSYNNFVNPRF